MVYFEKSLPAPECLAIEKSKSSGDYKCGNVLERLEGDFKNKCYICELKKPTTINVEHFISHKGDIDLKFDWNNLFWSCAHCNNTKLAKYSNLLNCTKAVDNVETALEYKLNPFPHEMVEINVRVQGNKVDETRELLLEVYNGTTILKKLEAANLRNKLLNEIMEFQRNLQKFYDNENTPDTEEYFLNLIKKQLSISSSFTAFKRWIVRNNKVLKGDLEQYFD